ncbi:F-box domain-containing protein [Favolaschia claudopus]|uniref:F-box domain-containing protein n=1 Tax=Favolaschia claudopus TaxID=2862362 RepID=A0AAW0CBG7_9AGAR
MLAVLEADRARVLEITHQIIQLQRAIAALRDEQVAAQQRLDSYIYPVLTLPNEITSEIFVHFLPPEPGLPEVNSRLSPTRLTHVCRKWRAVAVATPALWKGLRVIVPPSLGRDLKGLASLADMCLQRSGYCPLSIEFYGSMGNTDRDDNLLSTLLSYPKRLQYLKLDLCPPQSLPQIDSPMALLQSLELILFLESQLDEIASWNMPKLRDVMLSNEASLKAVLPWGQLTSLSFHRINPNLCLPVLRKTSNLLFCTLNFTGRIYMAYTGSGIINLPALTSLVIRMDGGENFATGILTDLVVPALQQLEVPESLLGRDPINLLTSFISKSGCTLRRLFITSRQMHKHKVKVKDEQYRAACPSVVDFSSMADFLFTFDPTDSDDSGAEDSDREELSDSENDSGDSGSGSE